MEVVQPHEAQLNEDDKGCARVGVLKQVWVSCARDEIDLANLIQTEGIIFIRQCSHGQDRRDGVKKEELKAVTDATEVRLVDGWRPCIWIYSETVPLQWTKF